MTNVRIKIPLCIADDNETERMQRALEGFQTNWNFSDYVFAITSVIYYNKQPDSVYPQFIKYLESRYEKTQSDFELINEYNEFVNNGGQMFEHTASINFEFHLPFTIYIKSDSIYSSTSYKRLDEFYENEMKKLIFALVMAILLVNPHFITPCGVAFMYINDEQYITERFFKVDNHHCAVLKYNELFETELCLNQTFEWVKRHTNLLHTTERSPVIFGALTYILNRECHESLIYSIIALESVYTPNSKGISNTLQKRITTVFPAITKEQIKQIYAKRSKYVHGEIKIGLFPFYDEVMEDDHDFYDSATLATAMLIETLRILIANNSVSFVFYENITFDYA